MTLLRPTRRDLLKLAAVAPAFALPAPLAALGTPAGTQAGYHRFRLGEARITILSDGHLAIPTAQIGVNADQDEVQAFLTAHRLATDVSYNHTNHVLIETGDATVLVDVGSGSRFLDTAGRLMSNLEAAAVDPGAITHVVITHAHPDHVWGIRDDFDEPIFPDASYTIGAAEYGYWMQDDLVNRVAPEAQQFVVGAVNSLSAEGVDWTMAEQGHEVVPGVSLIDTPGHTHGHMSIHVESAGERLIALGDAMRHAYVDFERPHWVGSPDMDPDRTVMTRLRLLDMAAADGIALVGYHFPFPGVGHVMRDGDGYRFVPAIWMWEE
jgi:glyoxylase-like metal-dependent hydrolase (beta-lactamase superfamily II)